MSMFTIPAVDNRRAGEIQQHIDIKTKPIGSLGQLEEIAKQIALIQQSEVITVKKPTMLVFAADHGIAEQGVSIAPSAVTTQMVKNFLNGGAAINCFCRTNGLDLYIIDAGIKNPIVHHPDLIDKRISCGTQDFTKAPAMSLEQVEQSLSNGASVVERCYISGSNLVAFGEMGIGNTSSASAIVAASLGIPSDDCVGLGTGITQEQLTKKKALIAQALELHAEQLTNPMNILAHLGGFEIAQIVGGMLHAAQNQMLILVDGFISTAAALIATKINPNCRDYMFFCHHSEESGHSIVLEHLNARPILDLGMRLGEGTGAALALPIIRSACDFYTNMSTFADAGVLV